MNSKVNTQKDKRKLLLLLLLLLCAGITVGFLTLRKGGTDRTAWLEKKLQNSSSKTIEINDRIIVTKPIAVNGEKTITGTGTIIYKPEISQKMRFESYRIPEDECQTLKIADLSQMDSMFDVSEDGSLIISGSLILDADHKSVCINVSKTGKLTVSEEAVLKNGMGATVLSDGELSVTGGTIEADEGYNVMSNGTMTVTGGTIKGGGKRMMNIVANGTVDIKGGTISEAKGTNIYLLDGTLKMSGGTVTGAAVDNIYAASGDVDVTGGALSEGKHGVHNVGTASVTGGTYENNTSHIYNEGIATTTGATFGNSFGSNLVNSGKNAQMKMTNIVIESATSHGVYNVRGAKLDAKKLTVKSALAKGIHNGGGYFTGKDITIVRASGVGVGNDIEKGWTGDGEVTIDGLKILKASYHSLTNANGVMTVRDAELGLISANCIQITGGVFNLENANIKGTSGNGTYHVFYIQNGVVNAQDVTIERSVSRGIQNRGGEFNGKNITISNTGGTAVGNMVSADGVTNGNVTIDGLTISDASGYSIQNSGDGIIAISNAVVKLSDRTAVRAEDGEIKLTNVEIIGVGNEKDATSKYGGITSVGGKVTLKGVKVRNMLARGISLTSGEIVGSGITIDQTGGTGIAVENGSIDLSKVTTSNVKGYNVDVQKGSAKISQSILNKGTTNSVRLKAGSLNLSEVIVNGTPEVTNSKGEVEKCHGILAQEGQLSLNNVTIQDTTGRGLDNRGATVIGEALVVQNAGGTSVRNEKGSMQLDGLAVANGTGYNVDVQSGKVTISNGVLDKSQSVNVHIKDGTLTLKDTVVHGTPATTTGKGETKVYEGILAKAGKVKLSNVMVQNTSGRSISNTGATLTGTDVKIENTQQATSLYNASNTTLKGLFIAGNQKGYNVDNRGTLKITNGQLDKTNVINVNLGKDSTTVFNNVVVEGTANDHAVYVKENAKLDFDGLTIRNAAARALTNGNADKAIAGGTVKGKNLIIVNAVKTALANDQGTMIVDGLSIEGAKAHAIDNQGTMEVSNVKLFNGNGVAIYNLADFTLRNYEISNNAGRAVYNSGQTELGHGTIDAGEFDAVYIKDGKVTLDGTAKINSDKYSVNLTKAGEFCMEDGATLISSAKVYLPTGSAVKLLGNRIGNTTAQKIRLAPQSTEYDTKYVETTSEDFAKELELANIFTVVTVSVVADGKDMVAAKLQNVEYDKEATVVEVSTWADMKNAIEAAEESAFLKLVLKNDIKVTDEGVIRQGEDVRVKVAITDEEKGYTITRTELEQALFTINVGSELILDGTLTLDGASSKENAAEEAMILNKGTLSINSQVILKGGYKSSSANTLDTSRSTSSAGAIETIGILNLYGTVTTSSSGNGSAISSLGGTLTVEGAKLNHNVGRALRVVDGKATIRQSELNYNIGANGGGALLIDYADVDLYDSELKGNESVGNGGAVQLNDSEYELYLNNCFIVGNKCTTSGKQGGGIYLNTAKLVLDDCTVKENAVNGAGGGIRIGTGATLTLSGNTALSDNTATSYGTQLWVNAADATIHWSSEVSMSVTNLDVAKDSVGMIGLNKPGVNLSLSGAMSENNNITVKAKELSIGDTILYGYDEMNQDAEINLWIANAADNFIITNPIGLKVDEKGKVNKGEISLSVSTWAELKSAIENEQYKGYSLAISLENSIVETSDAIRVDGVSVTLTDNNKNYAIERTDLTQALFEVEKGALLTLDGTLILDGQSSSSSENSKECLLNKGTLIVNRDITIKNGYKTVTNNSLESTNTKTGGAIESNGTLKIYGTITTSGSTGGSAVAVLGGTFIAEEAHFNKNSGRAVRVATGNAQFVNVEFKENTLSGHGGALLIDGGTVSVNGGSFLSNSVSGSKNGGAVYVQSAATLAVSNCTFDNNSAVGGNGGAIYSNTSGKVSLDSCDLGTEVGNLAKHGGVIYVHNEKDADVAMDGCIVKKNSADGGNGGFIYSFANAGTITLTGCTIGTENNGNSATGQGGAIFIKDNGTDNDTVDMQLSNCTLAYNQSTKRGGAIRIEAGILAMSGCTISNNYGKQSGGAFYINKNAEVELTTCVLNGNHSDGEGQVIHVLGGVMMTGCNINSESSINATNADIYREGNPTVTNK